jgi:replicative DNA helicase
MLPEVVGWLSPKDFYETRNAAVFGAMLALHEDRARPDAVTVFARLGNEEMGAYLAGLVADVPSPAGFMDYAALVKDRSVARGVLSAAMRISAAAYEAVHGSEALDEARRLLDEVEDGADAAFSGMPELADRALDACEHPLRGTVGSGLSSVDSVAGLFRPGQSIVVGARPGAGKTALATHLAVCAAKRGTRAVIASYEMSSADLWVRMTCAEAGLPMQEVLRGRLLPELRESRVLLDGLPLTVAHAPRMTLPRLFAGCRRARAGVVVIDYLQLVPMPRAETRERQVAEASRQCKLAAQELGIPVVVCVQLNRGVEHRGPESRPRLSDIRESGALEQDADVVLLLDREELRQGARDVRAGAMDVMIAKNRNGPTGPVTVGWHGPSMRVYDAQATEDDVVEQGREPAAAQGGTGRAAPAGVRDARPEEPVLPAPVADVRGSQGGHRMREPGEDDGPVEEGVSS